MDLSGATLAELNAELITRTAPVESLDRLFALPEWVTDPDLCNSYEVLVARLRRETDHLPLNTLQQMRIERIVFNYIVLKFREAHAGSDHQFMDHLKDWNTYWASITREFDAVLRAWQPKEQDAIMHMVKLAVEEVIATIEDTGVRNDLVRRFPDTFKRMGLISA
jgi:hypothetical protein